jgi:hypothetical protein
MDRKLFIVALVWALILIGMMLAFNAEAYLKCNCTSDPYSPRAQYAAFNPEGVFVEMRKEGDYPYDWFMDYGSHSARTGNRLGAGNNPDITGYYDYWEGQLFWTRTYIDGEMIYDNNPDGDETGDIYTKVWVEHPTWHGFAIETYKYGYVTQLLRSFGPMEPQGWRMFFQLSKSMDWCRPGYYETKTFETDENGNERHISTQGWTQEEHVDTSNMADEWGDGQHYYDGTTPAQGSEFYPLGGMCRIDAGFIEIAGPCGPNDTEADYLSLSDHGCTHLGLYAMLKQFDPSVDLFTMLRVLSKNNQGFNENGEIDWEKAPYVIAAADEEFPGIDELCIKKIPLDEIDNFICETGKLVGRAVQGETHFTTISGKDVSGEQMTFEPAYLWNIVFREEWKDYNMYEEAFGGLYLDDKDCPPSPLPPSCGG